MKLLLIILLILPTIVFGVNCERHPIYCNIHKVSPKLSYKYKMELSNIISKYTKKYKLDYKLFTAILRQESNFNLKAKNCVDGLEYRVIETQCYEEECIDVKDWVEVKACRDFGISQLYHRTAKRYGFDINKLTSDLDYSIKAGAIVLYNLKKRYKDIPDYWVMYNCGTRQPLTRTTCQTYKKLVERYINP